MNNKGVTLTELLVSVVMLSTAMILMYSLMSDIRLRKKEVDLRSNDIVKVGDVEHKLQQFIMEPINYGRDPVSSVRITTGTNSVVINIDGTIHTINANDSVITYSQNKDTSKKGKWVFNDKKCNSIVNAEAGNARKYSYIIITCTSDFNEDIKDSIRIPMYFQSLSGNITQ